MPSVEAVGAMRGTERVVDVEVAERGELLGESGIVLLFLGHGSAGFRAADFAGRRFHRLDFRAHAIGRHLYRAIEQLLEAGRYGL
jgi:hypothetical protein